MFVFFASILTPRVYLLLGLKIASVRLSVSKSVVNNTFQTGHLKVQQLHKRHKRSRNGSILVPVCVAEDKAVALAIISSDYHSQAFTFHELRPTLYMRSHNTVEARSHEPMHV